MAQDFRSFGLGRGARRAFGESLAGRFLKLAGKSPIELGESARLLGLSPGQQRQTFVAPKAGHLGGTAGLKPIGHWIGYWGVEWGGVT